MFSSKIEIRSASDVIEFINLIEIELKPQNWKIDGIDVWPILRVNLYYEISMNLLGNKKKGFNIIQKVMRVLKSIVFSIRPNKTVSSNVLFISDGLSYINFYNKLYDRFCDPLIELLVEDKDKYSWSKVDIVSHYSDDKYFDTIDFGKTLDFLTFKAILKSFFFPSEYNKSIIGLCEFINTSTHLVNWNYASVMKKISTITSMTEWYRKQLNPEITKIVLIVSFYSNRGMALIKACKDLGIKTFDIQHGVQGEFHAGYSKWLNAPINGYNTLPDNFLVWSEVETRFNKDAVIIGNEFESKWYGNDELVNNFDYNVQVFTKKLSAKINILFSVQYGISYKSSLFELIKYTQGEFNWLIRFHPVMSTVDRSRFIKILKSNDIVNCEFELSSTLPLYSLLRNISLHVTHSSSTVLEALNFNVSSLLIDKFGEEYFNNLLGAKVRYENLIENQIIAMRELSTLTYNEKEITTVSHHRENFRNFINSKL